ncbi:MAG: hypothetical protein K2Y25_14260 [Pseudomonadaceae bacterium]|jgi:hypothetical protein|nr:hypothetical protein [Pseudomonadaceae bacterium]
MKSFTTRYTALFLVAFLTSSASNVALAVDDEVPVDDSVTAFRNIEQSLNQGQLQQAEGQLNNLKQRAAGDTRLEQYQRQIAETYLQQGQNALQKGDLNAASAALSRARGLLPQAPALTSGLDTAITTARANELAAAEKTRLAAQQAAAKETAAKAEQARQQKLAAERLAQQKKAAAAAAVVSAPVVAAAPAKPQALLIKPDAASSTIALPMLDDNDSAALRQLLDSVASDVVNFNCTVSIEVRQGKDFPWVGSLLSVRVKKLNPNFKLELQQVLNPQQAPQLVLTPRSK